jgi:glycosyltransferase involved in cell wall biosynthesis
MCRSATFATAFAERQQKMQPLISIIIPVYNAEQYLHRCVDSILAQTYKNLEIILVNDGSKDNSGKICDEYAELDNRVRVIHKQNGGAASTRNAGLDVANGEYIAFIDSDDSIIPDMYDTLYNRISKSNADIAICGFVMIYPDFQRIIEVPNEKFYKIEELFYDWLYYYYQTLLSVPWNKLYKKQLIIENNIRFPNRDCEDTWFVTDCLNKCDNGVEFVKITPYLYYFGANGDSLNARYTLEGVLQSKEHIYDIMLKFLPNEKDKIEKIRMVKQSEERFTRTNIAIVYNKPKPCICTFNDLTVVLRNSESMEYKLNALAVYFLPRSLFKFTLRVFSKLFLKK